ncbi:hypothetical protein [Candidatus Chloroploca sp. Khr17]|uniref:hypothetical protein n=1 Tax=Candidatus Chloroploca sp. Khr17 TaxID=2496869 RepID=UPI00101CAE50|nr:hypothetical protein [Candidatus Chloroploca sp. Khr17]
MNQRALFAIAAAVTAFVLILLAVFGPGFSGSSTTSTPTDVAPLQATTAIGTQPMTTPATLQPSNPAGSYPVSADQAGSLAVASSSGATLTGTPTLVTYQGAVAYEVPLSTGLVYVDATSGQILATPGTSTTTTSNGNSTTNDNSGDDDDEEDDD